MTKRAEQRAETRSRILSAAAEAFSELGFQGASTRDIATRAGRNQGLITYHFRSKDELWRAATDRIFEQLRATLTERIATVVSDDPKDRAREAIREYVRFVAAHPELFRIMVDEGKRPSERMNWLVDTHMKTLYAGGIIQTLGLFGPDFSAEESPHFHYVLVGAASVIFAVAPECRRLTGLDPTTDAAVETHANFVARMLVP